jgi:hypothetical protein
MARQHVVAVNAASEVATVHDVGPRDIEFVTAADGSPLRAISGIVPAMRACFSESSLLYETGLAPWAKPPASMSINGYHQFPGPPALPAAAATHSSVLATTFVRAATRLPALPSR